MSVTNQLSLAHLTVIITMFRSSPLIDDLFCKVLGYLLTCVTRLSSWLPSFVALERAYTTIFLNKHWFKQPRVARSLMFFTLLAILLSSLDELLFVKLFISIDDGNSAMCVIEYPSSRRSMWISIHQIVSVSHFLFPLLINLFSTLTIMTIVIKSKVNIRRVKKGKLILPSIIRRNSSILCIATSNEARRTILRNVLNENREMITRPAITLIPSIFSLFSLSFLIISFSLGCQNLEDNPLRYLLIIFYFVTFFPQMLMFYLYIYPSSLYWKEWQSTTIIQQIAVLRQRRPLESDTTFSPANAQKTRDVSSVPNRE